jgi:hypothetical protein
MGMDGISIWQLIIILFIILISLLIFRPIVNKAGYSGWWALTMLVPLVNLIMIWVFAFAKWPAEKSKNV